MYFADQNNFATVELRFSNNQNLYYNKNSLCKHSAILKKMIITENDKDIIELYDENIATFNQLLCVVFNDDLNFIDDKYDNITLVKVVELAYRYDIKAVIDIINAIDIKNDNISNVRSAMDMITIVDGRMTWLVIKFIKLIYKKIDVMNIVNILNTLQTLNIGFNDLKDFMLNNDLYNTLNGAGCLALLNINCFNYIRTWGFHMIIFYKWLADKNNCNDTNILCTFNIQDFPSEIKRFSKDTLKMVKLIIDKIDCVTERAKYYKMLIEVHESK